MIAIGIDPGVNTGVAVWSAQLFALQSVETMSIIQAFDKVQSVVRSANNLPCPVIVIVEDARKRKGIFTIADENSEKYGGGVREGVGSIKRDSSIWEAFLQYHGIPYEMRMPRGTKMSDEAFRKLTGWQGRTSKHSRDAAMVVFQLNSPAIRLKLQTYTEGGNNEPALPAGTRLRTRSRRPRRY